MNIFNPLRADSFERGPAPALQCFSQQWDLWGGRAPSHRPVQLVEALQAQRLRCVWSLGKNLIPPSLPLSPCLDECAHCTMSRRVCDFTVWVGSPHPKLSTSLRAACWTVGELVCRKRSPLQREAFWVPMLQTEHHKGLNEELLLVCFFYLCLLSYMWFLLLSVICKRLIFKGKV